MRCHRCFLHSITNLTKLPINVLLLRNCQITKPTILQILDNSRIEDFDTEELNMNFILQVTKLSTNIIGTKFCRLIRFSKSMYSHEHFERNMTNIKDLEGK